jgi:flagellar P-ring protein FlgI
MKRFLILFLFIYSCGFSATVDLRNIVSIDGLQDNPLLGYGIVVGLKGTGDSENGSQTKEIISRIANNFGFKISPEKLKPKNSAVVLVSSIVTPFIQPGSRADVKVSSIFDAKTLEGGELIITPLMGGDSAIYAIAQGSVMTERNAKGVMGTIPQGAIIQKQIDSTIVSSNNEIALTVLDSQGFQVITKVVTVLRQKYPDSISSVVNNKIFVKLPADTEVYQFISDVFKLQVDIEEEPSVLIDSKSGILISGGNVYISQAAVSFGATRLTIGGQANQPGSSGKPEENVRLLKETATVQDLVDGLNQIGASGGDIAKILQLLYKNGNLKGKLIVQ